VGSRVHPPNSGARASYPESAWFSAASGRRFLETSARWFFAGSGRRVLRNIRKSEGFRRIERSPVAGTNVFVIHEKLKEQAAKVTALCLMPLSFAVGSMLGRGFDFKMTPPYHTSMASPALPFGRIVDVSTIGAATVGDTT
jgi:hypothetical protein